MGVSGNTQASPRCSSFYEESRVRSSFRSVKKSWATESGSTRCMSPWQCGQFHRVDVATEGVFSGRGLVEPGAAERQHAGSSAVGEQAEVADAGKASRQDMLYEAAQELVGSKCHGALFAAVGVVLPAEADLGSRDGKQPMVGDGNAMRVASQIMQHVRGAAKGRLGIDDPVLPIKLAQETGEALALHASGMQSPKKRS